MFTWDRYDLPVGDHAAALGMLRERLDAKDNYTATHCQRASMLTQLVAVKVGLEPHQVQTAMLAALYHDIGKIGVTNAILNKPGQLTGHEMRLMTLHPTVGRELLESFNMSQRAAVVIQQHHEAWDGSGYPLGLRGEQILPEARVLQVCDVYDALISDRPYRTAYPQNEALDIIRAGINKDYDPNAAAVLLEVSRQLEMAA
jgi:putative nucleotidyltransferase with HDIG domain